MCFVLNFVLILYSLKKLLLQIPKIQSNTGKLSNIFLNLLINLCFSKLKLIKK
jgi:hypothetical protein